MIIKRIFTLLLTFAISVAANMLCIFLLPIERLEADTNKSSSSSQHTLFQRHQPHAIEVVIPPQQERQRSFSCKPNPLLLAVNVDEARRVTLNGSMDFGTLADTGKLTCRLEESFAARLTNRAYRENLTELDEDLPEFEKIERTVFVKIDSSVSYGQALKLINELKGAGAQPIKLVIDEGNFAFVTGALPSRQTTLIRLLP